MDLKRADSVPVRAEAADSIRFFDDLVDSRCWNCASLNLLSDNLNFGFVIIESKRFRGQAAQRSNGMAI
jgi:hypothetical protein